MLAFAGQNKAKILEGDSFRFFGDWKNPVLRELAPAMRGAKPLALAHACRPKVSAAEVSDALKFLVSAGLLEKDDQGNYTQTDKVVTTGPMKAVPVAIRGLHRQMGEFALEALDTLPISERHFSGITMGVTAETYAKVVEELAQCRKRIVSLVADEPHPDKVCRLNFQLFPLTENLNNGKNRGKSTSGKGE
jgi:uncharacterized protein (TIGR02147 family)